MIEPLFYWHDNGRGDAYRVHPSESHQWNRCEKCQPVYSRSVVDALNARIAELEHQAAAAIPNGMVVVPKLPTKQMYEDGRDAVKIAIDKGYSPMAIAADAFEAMIVAAQEGAT